MRSAAVVALVALAVAVAVGADDSPRPVFVRRVDEHTNVEAGGALELECRATLEPRATPDALKKLKLRWLKNETPLNDRNRTTTRRRVDGSHVVLSLRIGDVEVLDKGFYRCVAAYRKSQEFSEGLVTVVERATPPPPPPPPSPSPSPTSRGEPESPAICQPYVGRACERFLADEFVYVPPNSTQRDLERLLAGAFTVVSYSKDVSENCEKYTLPSICYSVFPICRRPAETNERYAAYARARKASEPNAIERRVEFDDVEPSFELGEFEFEPPNSTSRRRFVRESRPRPRADDAFGASRDSLSLRRVCRRDCEILENELCQKEYAIAKRHPDIGQKITLEECRDLPVDSPDCLEVGLEKQSDLGHACYWETGHYYRGDVSVTAAGAPCMKWAEQLKLTISSFPELAGGHNHCRNPANREPRPWCFVDRNDKIEKQFCDVPKCSQKIWIYIISAIVFACVAFVSCLMCALCRHRNSKNDTAAIRNINLPNADKNIYGDSRLNSPIELSELVTGRGSLANGSGSRGNRILRVPQYGLSQIRLVEELGEGAFGKVYKGELTRENDTVFVAVKALKENASHKTQTDFKREIELISELHHENIVCILGVVLREEPLCMLFEYMAKGDLHEFLVSKAPPNGGGFAAHRLLCVSRHIASGMEYLAAHHYVHRDLAARNCLVADNLIVKISDFGLSRDIYSSDYYRVQSKSLLPVRWMPPESILYGKFTTESDVWSYGVVLWEIYSYGLQPYYGYSNQEVISMVRSRELLKMPADCPSEVYKLMKECWHQTAINRPNFTEILNRLSNIKVNAGLLGDTSDSSGAHSGQRPPISFGDPRERIPLISHHSSSNGSLAGSIPRKLSGAGSVRSHASTRLMVSSSDVTSSSDNCDTNIKVKKSSCGSLLDGHSSNINVDRRDVIVKIPPVSQPYAF